MHFFCHFFTHVQFFHCFNHHYYHYYCEVDFIIVPFTFILSIISIQFMLRVVIIVIYQKGGMKTVTAITYAQYTVHRKKKQEDDQKEEKVKITK
jgi:hypothetical protein